MEIADSLSAKQKKQFLELTDKVSLLNPESYQIEFISKYEKLLKDIDDLYDGKIDYITEVLKKIDRNKKLSFKTESLIKEFVKI
jgi:hypothetical protein